ncbi:hypothetical protein [Methanolacinia paynteri]|uniref:hypothetical protein n=1 Tax=Methanolacinia paynteri TaxID=230356 RepID=UPI00064F203F|nr:hypothetical protein [Methanolacinia paynteri]
MKCAVLFQVRDEDGLLLVSKDAVIPAYEALRLLSDVTREDENNDEEIVICRDHEKSSNITPEDPNHGLKEEDLFDEDEKNFLGCCKNAENAVEEFGKAFPNSDKNDEAIALTWSNLKKEGLLNSLKTGNFVKITDSNFPQYDTTGRVLQVKGKDVLVSFPHSAVWIDRSVMEVVDSPSKK